MKRLMLAMTLFLATAIHHGPAFANDNMALEIAHKMPIVFHESDPVANAYLRKTILPELDRRGLREALANVIRSDFSETEQRRILKLVADEQNMAIFIRFLGIGEKMKSWVSQQLLTSLRCIPVDQRPEQFAQLPQFNSFEQGQYCQ